MEAARAEGDSLPAAGPAHGAAAARPGHHHHVGSLRGAGHEPGTAAVKPALVTTRLPEARLPVEGEHGAGDHGALLRPELARDGVGDGGGRPQLAAVPHRVLC